MATPTSVARYLQKNIFVYLIAGIDEASSNRVECFGCAVGKGDFGVRVGALPVKIVAPKAATHAAG